VRAEPRSKVGFEVDLLEVRVLNPAAHDLPFHSSSEITEVGMDVLLDHRPLSLRTEPGEEIFRVQADILEGFRSFLRKNRFTEIVTSSFISRLRIDIGETAFFRIRKRSRRKIFRSMSFFGFGKHSGRALADDSLRRLRPSSTSKLFEFPRRLRSTGTTLG
jgi:aspartyl/asparaginyl-tRNA synthetase